MNSRKSILNIHPFYNSLSFPQKNLQIEVRVDQNLRDVYRRNIRRNLWDEFGIGTGLNTVPNEIPIINAEVLSCLFKDKLAMNGIEAKVIIKGDSNHYEFWIIYDEEPLLEVNLKTSKTFRSFQKDYPEHKFDLLMITENDRQEMGI